jgi:hypothetical protein
VSLNATVTVSGLLLLPGHHCDLVLPIEGVTAATPEAAHLSHNR